MRVYARELTELLPHLRRYARALTGSVERGDDLVTRCVETALAAPTSFGLPRQSRLPLYALLHLLFDGDGRGEPVPTPHPVERALSHLPELDRRVYLLTTLEDLKPAEVAQVLEIDPSEVAAALGRAREGLRRELTARVLVVEDNAIVAMDLGEVISTMGHVVVGTAATEREAMTLVDQEKPTLALMDIRLAEGDSGIAVAAKLRERFDLPVIFVTGYAGDLKRNSLEHLGPVVRKPFSADEIRGAITRAVFTPRPAVLA